MHLALLILWLSAFVCASSASAAEIVNLERNKCNSPNKVADYDARWSDAGSACIKKLIARAGSKRKEIWNERFPNAETVCREYELYWWRANVFADDMGMPRKNNDTNWLKHALGKKRTSKLRINSILDRKAITCFKNDINEFAGRGADVLVDRSILRFEEGQKHSLFSPIKTLPLVGDFYFPSPTNPRYWGESGVFK